MVPALSPSYLQPDSRPVSSAPVRCSSSSQVQLEQSVLPVGTPRWRSVHTCLFSPLYFCLIFWAAKIMNAELREMTGGQRGSTCESAVSLLKQKAPCLCDRRSTLYIRWIQCSAYLWLPNPRQSWGLVRLHTGSRRA